MVSKKYIVCILYIFHLCQILEHYQSYGLPDQQDPDQSHHLHHGSLGTQVSS